MLFHVTWTVHSPSEERGQRSLTLFQNWQPPAGAEFKGFYGSADGQGGVAIIESGSAQALTQTTAPWIPWLRFEITPILPIEEGAAIGGEPAAWRASIS